MYLHTHFAKNCIEMCRYFTNNTHQHISYMSTICVIHILHVVHQNYECPNLLHSRSDPWQGAMSNPNSVPSPPGASPGGPGRSEDWNIGADHGMDHVQNAAGGGGSVRRLSTWVAFFCLLVVWLLGGDCPGGFHCLTGRCSDCALTGPNLACPKLSLRLTRKNARTTSDGFKIKTEELVA